MFLYPLQAEGSQLQDEVSEQHDKFQRLTIHLAEHISALVVRLFSTRMHTCMYERDCRGLCRLSLSFNGSYYYSLIYLYPCSQFFLVFDEQDTRPQGSSGTTDTGTVVDSQLSKARVYFGQLQADLSELRMVRGQLLYLWLCVEDPWIVNTSRSLEDAIFIFIERCYSCARRPVIGSS